MLRVALRVPVAVLDTVALGDSGSLLGVIDALFVVEGVCGADGELVAAPVSVPDTLDVMVGDAPREMELLAEALTVVVEVAVAVKLAVLLAVAVPVKLPVTLAVIVFEGVSVAPDEPDADGVIVTVCVFVGVLPAEIVPLVDAVILGVLLAVIVPVKEVDCVDDGLEEIVKEAEDDGVLLPVVLTVCVDEPLLVPVWVLDHVAVLLGD